MPIEASPITPCLRPFRNHGIVDEDAITLRIRPLRWRDRALHDVRRWAGATATIAAVAGAFLFFAAPSEAARVDARPTPEPTSSPLTKATPVLASARFELDPVVRDAPGSIEDEEEEIVIIIEDEEDDGEVLVFDDSLDAPSAAAMAELHIDLNEHALAVQYALEAVEAEPRNPAHRALLGKAHLLSGDRTAARRAFRRARRLRR